MIRLATRNDLSSLAKIAQIVKDDLHLNGIDQWSDTYPLLSDFQNDLDHHQLFLYEDDYGVILGSMTIVFETEDVYKQLNWKSNRAIIIHRFMVHPNSMRQGIASALIENAMRIANEMNIDGIQIDTHPDNFRMARFLVKHHFNYIGYMKEIHRDGYERIICSELKK